MDPLSIALLVAAAAFAVVHGVNNGATLIVTALRGVGIGPRGALGIAMLAIAVAPLAFGTAIASTVADGFVTGEGVVAAMLIAVVVSSVLTLALSLGGVPMSLTLAFVGALVGAGLATSADVRWDAVGRVLVAALAAPALGAVVAVVLLGAIVPALSAAPAARVAAVGHWIAYPALCVAYGANDAQKMLGVALVAVGATGGAAPQPGVVAVLAAGTAVLFGMGAVVGAGARTQRSGAGLAPLRPVDAAAVEGAAAISMVSSAIAGTPVALAQTVAGAVIGSGSAQSARRVRWRQAARILVSWAVSIPLAVGIGWAVAALAAVVERWWA